MQVWNVLHADRWKCRTQKWCKKSPSAHHCTTLSGYIFATEAHIDNGENLLSSNVSPTCPYNMLNFGPLAAEIVSLVWGTPTNFKRFRVLAALLHNQTAALNRGRHLYSAGRPSRWALAHISSLCCVVYESCAQWYGHTHEQFLQLLISVFFRRRFAFCVFLLFCPVLFAFVLLFLVSSVKVKTLCQSSRSGFIFCVIHCRFLAMLPMYSC